jgi:ATP-dependent Clp protease protease subunit
MGRSVDGNVQLGSSCSESQQTVTIQQAADQRIVYLTGSVTETSILAVNAQLLTLASQGDEPISLVISTYGGEIYEMFSLYDTIKFLNCPVHTVGLGKIMSAGVLLLASGERGKRLIGPSARVMVHSISSCIYGNVFDLENELQEVKYLQRFMTDALLQETKMNKEQLDKLFKSKTDTYFSALECVKLGIADKIMSNKKK